MEAISKSQPQVFINFRGKDVRKSFVSFLVKDMRTKSLRLYIDEEELRSEPIDIIFTRIDQSKIALAIFSTKYGESNWCLNELGKILKNVKDKKIRIIPIFFDVAPSDVKYQLGEFGVNLYQGDRYDLAQMTQWRKDLNSAGSIMGMLSSNYKNDSLFVEDIIVEVNKVIAEISGGRELTNMVSLTTSMVTSNGDSSSIIKEHFGAHLPPYGIEKRLKQLEERLDFESLGTQIVGIVGISGIGKTTLAKTHFGKWETRFIFKRMILSIHDKPKPKRKLKKGELSFLEKELLDGERDYNKAAIFKKRSFLVLDDVSEKEQIQFLLDNLHRIAKGSKIVITTRDKSWINELRVDNSFFTDIYEVPGLDDSEALQLFSYYAFTDKDYVPTENFTKFSEEFVEYAGGNPRALKQLGKELFGKDEDHWRRELKELPHCCNEKIRKGFRITYDELTNQQKDVFLDIACFFRSEDEDYLTTLLSSNVSCGEAAKEVRDLAEKFMISVSAGQIEMSDLLCSLGKELGLLASEENEWEASRLWDHEKVLGALVNEEGTESVRGILLDVSKLTSGIAIDENNLTLMPNLRYLKIFDSRCPRQCNCKVHLPEGLNFPLKEIRYLHWLKFPLEELPSDFIPENLIDLRLPYSKIQRVWCETKDTPNLTWVDLSHSTELIDLLALSNAGSLRRLNLEGCIMLTELPKEMENMKRLAFLNLKGCIGLSSLPQNLNLISLKTLILSDCSNFNEFQVISKNLEHLHLDGTTIKNLPLTIKLLQRLTVLNLKGCKMLNSLPVCLDKLKALEELILSGCSMLENFPEIKENMENLQILLLDRTPIKEVPPILLHCTNSLDKVNVQRPPLMSDLTLLGRLCLSGNDKISRLESSISDLYHLKWIDLKYCKNLLSISTLPSNLQCLDAHACISLKTVSRPLALMPTKQVPSSFIFTNCEKLEHLAKNEITCYGHNKGQLLSETLNRHNKGLAFEALVSTCFPGNEVPAWFHYKASGAVMEPELPRHWSESGFVGIALCAIVSFEEHTIQNNNLQVKCICGFGTVKTSFSHFSCPVGGLFEIGNARRTIKSAHVFIGYTNWLNIKKCQEEDGKKGCVPTKASIKFKVVDDTGEVTNCKVLKCGFSLVCESSSWEASSRTDEVEQGQVESLQMNKLMLVQ